MASLATPTMEDPFAKIRSQSTVSAIDRLDDDEYEELKNKIRDVYLMWAKNEPIANMPKQEALRQLQPVWIKTVEASLAQSPGFQRIVLDEEVTSGSHIISSLAMKDDWALGLYLQGFYDVFDAFEDGWEYIANQVFPTAVKQARNVLVQISRKHGSRALTAAS
jgi:hypothetical protein